MSLMTLLSAVIIATSMATSLATVAFGGFSSEDALCIFLTLLAIPVTVALLVSLYILMTDPAPVLMQPE